MRFLPRSLRLISKRLRRKRSSGSSRENAAEDLEAQMARELEETLMENSDFLYLRGEKLRIYESRMRDLAKLLTRGRPLPAETDQLSQLRSRLSSKSPLTGGTDVAGPSRSLDSAQDLIRSVHTLEGDSEDTETVRSIPVWAQDAESDMPIDVSDSTTIDLTPAHMNHKRRSYTDFDVEEGASEELRTIPLSAEDLPVGLSQGSVQKEALVAETADNLFAMFTDMNDWSQVAAGYSFADENTPSPMKVHSFYPLETQIVSLSLDDNAPQKPRVPEPEDSFSSREGILFAVGGYAITGESQSPSYRGSLSDLAASPDEIDTNGGDLLNDLRKKTTSTDRTCSFAHVRAVSDYPSNVWEDVAPTRLSSSITNVSMDKPQILRSS